jgi:hypothetical protein
LPGPSNLSILGLDIPLACDPAAPSGGPHHVTLALSLLATALAAAEGVARWVPGRWHQEGPRGLPAGSARPGLCRLRVYYDVEEDPEQ